MKKTPNLADIDLLVLDVDGVLTDGTIAINADGTESKFFNSLDGHGIRLCKRAGLEVAFISGRACEPLNWRARELEVEHVLQDCHNKLPALQKLLEQLHLSPDRVACVGDDVTDLPMIKYAGFGVAVANAVDEVKKNADYVTTHPGGRGAVREVIEYILRNSGRWHELMQRYSQ
ncbi:MAG: KdsC family phosphatase [Planctomycetota bacterium]|jgi:3-deoxy-D-manno-octulosonate 8-phosphate phosphatase (KDO 8-P phosphatase)